MGKLRQLSQLLAPRLCTTHALTLAVAMQQQRRQQQCQQPGQQASGQGVAVQQSCSPSHGPVAVRLWHATCWHLRRCQLRWCVCSCSSDCSDACVANVGRLASKVVALANQLRAAPGSLGCQNLRCAPSGPSAAQTWGVPLVFCNNPCPATAVPWHPC